MKRNDYLKAGVTHNDEAQCYFKLYGELYYHVPHYVKSYFADDNGIKVVYPKGSSMTMGYPITNERR